MKLSLAKDLAPLKAEAARKIDAEAEARALALSACPTIHAVKARRVNDAALVARLEGDAAAIFARAQEYDKAVLAIDAERLARKRAVAAAASEQEIRAIVAQAGA